VSDKPKIGVGIVTCNRENFFKQCLSSIPACDELAVVNDGTAYEFDKSRLTSFTQHGTNLGVGKSKNELLRFLLRKDCDYIFIIEDDIVMKDPIVFEKYIEHSKKTGLMHLMYGYHGPANKVNGQPNPRMVVDYGNGARIAFNQHCVGAFCLYTKKVLQNSGFMDEKFQNAFEHIDHSYRIVLDKYIPGYWWWPDINESWRYIDELACSEVSSTIRCRSDWSSNIQHGARHFYSKYGFSPVQVPDTSIEQIKYNLKEIHKNYGDMI